MGFLVITVPLLFLPHMHTGNSGGQVQPRVVTTADGASWWDAFTSFEEQMKSPDTVKSTFLADIDKLFAAALSAPEIAGIIVNPWHCTLQLDKELIRIIQPGRAG